MPNTSSAIERQRQNERRRLRNKMVRSQVKTSAKEFLDAAESKNKEAAQSTYVRFVSLIDSAVSKGVYHRNTAARKKARLQQVLQKLQ